MIIHVEKEIPLYKKLGVFTEAPAKAKRKVKSSSGAASNSLTDFTADVESEEELDVNDMQLDDVDNGDEDDLTAGSDDEELETDDPAETDDASDEPATDDENLTAGADDEGDGGDNTDEPATDDGDTGGGDEGGDEPVTDDGDGGDEPATDDGGGDDLTSGADDGEDDNGGDDSSDDSSSSDGNGKAFKKDDMKKFKLFQQFINLHTSLENYISKLNTADVNDAILGSAYRQLRIKFRELESLLYDYMVLKFSSDSYTSAVYFYERVKAAVLILFSLLEEAKNKSKENEGKGNKKKK